MTKSQNNPISVLIVDDHPPLRAGLRAMLEKAPDICVVGETGNGNEALEMLAELRPRIVLLDLKMPDFSPAQFEKWARNNYPKTVTLVLTGHDRNAYLVTMMEAGVAAYLDKTISSEQLISSIRRAARGESLFDRTQYERANRWRQEVSKKWDRLSGREREVLKMLTEGLDNHTIAASLNIKVGTVEKHLTSIYQKLSVTSRAEAMVWWSERGGDFRN